MAAHTEAMINVVLVHGACADGSGWEGVYQSLRKQKFAVSVVQNPTVSLADDVRRPEGPGGAEGARHPGGPLVWRSGDHRGGQRSEGRGDWSTSPRSRPTGESVSSLIKNPPPGQPVPPILPPQDGFLLLDKAKFPASFAADVDPERAAFMADSQVPWGLAALRVPERAGLEDEAQLVLGGDRRPDDPSGRPTHHVAACGVDGRRGSGKPCDLRLPP